MCSVRLDCCYKADNATQRQPGEKSHNSEGDQPAETVGPYQHSEVHRLDLHRPSFEHSSRVYRRWLAQRPHPED